MSDFKDIIYGLQQDIEIPETVWKKYTHALAMLPDKPEKSNGTFRARKIWPAAAVASLVIGVSVGASVYTRWSSGLEEKFQATQEQKQVLEEEHVTDFAGQAVTQGDITVTAQQSIVDNHFAYLSFKVEGYAVEDGMQPDFSGIRIKVGDGEEVAGSGSSSFGFCEGPAQGDKTCYTMEDGSLEYQIILMSSEKGYYIGKPIHVELKDLGTYSGKTGDVVADAEGEWSFDWVLPGSNAAKTFELNAPLEDSGATVLRAEISPLSISVEYEFPRVEETETGTDENGETISHTTYKEPPYLTGVRLKDGTIYTGITSGGGVMGYVSDDSDLYEYTGGINRIIDSEEIESLLFVKTLPEGEQPLGEENLYVVPVEP